MIRRDVPSLLDVSNSSPFSYSQQLSQSASGQCSIFRNGNDAEPLVSELGVLRRVQTAIGAAVSPDENRMQNLNRPIYTLDESDGENGSTTLLDRVCCNVPVIHPLRCGFPTAPDPRSFETV